jgi:hypothetical protein
MEKIWGRLKESNTAVFLLLLPVLAVYFVPLIAWLQIQIWVYGGHAIIFGERSRSSAANFCWQIANCIHLLLGAAIFLGWTALCVALLLGHQITL